MRIQKHPIRPDRIREIPKNFSWIDRRIIREKYLEKINVKATALYLVLVSVGDRYGLSYYSEPSLSRLLRLSRDHLHQARQELIDANLIAYEKPLYQVLCLERKNLVLLPISSRKGTSSPPPAQTNQKTSRQGAHSFPGKPSCETKSIAEVLNQIVKGDQHD